MSHITNSNLTWITYIYIYQIEGFEAVPLENHDECGFFGSAAKARANEVFNQKYIGNVWESNQKEDKKESIFENEFLLDSF